MKKKLNTKFDQAYKLASETKDKLPPDVMLQFYAYYKQATKGNNYYQSNNGNEDLRNAFKLNAWFQLGHLSEEDAKKEYIKLVKKYLKPKNK
ncbi:MAG: diazepam-binding inhibitor (GABA receptor modulating acyl-CoA-binding protein) [Candidatus Azotimanducaceae bacterium]|jgi:diazepam-binding inhibitor (GABA receptor modulating acyl-CoA-binding protein)|tara:strand:- start:194 stop:469 length:276 start_codon:yes stop_codon:yes gene_type:complete